MIDDDGQRQQQSSDETGDLQPGGRMTVPEIQRRDDEDKTAESQPPHTPSTLRAVVAPSCHAGRLDSRLIHRRDRAASRQDGARPIVGARGEGGTGTAQPGGNVVEYDLGMQIAQQHVIAVRVKRNALA